MGQRSQIVLIAPRVFYNEGNGNNNSGKVYISHNQWRYGENAIIVLADFIKKLNYLIKECKENDWQKPAYLINRLDDNANLCIRYAENHRLDWQMSQSHRFDDNTEAFQDYKDDTLEFLKHKTDNNNGWFFIRLNSRLEVSFGILNGNEDCNVIKSRTPQEYLKLSEKSNDEEFKQILKESLKYLKQFKQIEPLKELKQLKKRVGVN